MKKYLFGVLASVLIGCSTQPEIPSLQSNVQPKTEETTAMPKIASLPDLGPAPELTNDIWLNVDSPLRLENLRGKVVIIDMWTFG